MRVTISVHGVWHAFDLAEGLSDKGCLKEIHTSHPQRLLKTTLSGRHISTHILPEFVYQTGRRLPQFLNNFSTWNSPALRWKMQLFDRSVSTSLKPPQTPDEVFIGYAGACLSSLRRANSLGYTTVVERASAHIRTQRNLLEEEFQRTSKSNPISEQFIHREEQEYAETDFIVVPSEFAARSFIDQGINPSKIYTVPLGDDFSRGSETSPKPSIPEVRDVNEDDRYLLFAGAGSLQKGVHYLLDAWRKAKVGDADLILAGEIQSEVAPLIEETNESVHAIGWVDEIDRWYAHADGVVLPSVHDGFGRVIPEAMNWGVPVITTKNAGASECVRDGINGYVVEAGDSGSLAKAIEDLLDEDWKGDIIRDHIESNYRLGDYVNRAVSAYSEMLSEN